PGARLRTPCVRSLRNTRDPSADTNGFSDQRTNAVLDRALGASSKLRTTGGPYQRYQRAPSAPHEEADQPDDREDDRDPDQELPHGESQPEQDQDEQEHEQQCGHSGLL